MPLNKTQTQTIKTSLVALRNLVGLLFFFLKKEKFTGILK